MTFADLIALQAKAPFRPFRIYLSDGTTYTVKHPELFAVGLSTVRLDQPGVADQPVPGAEILLLAMSHITRIEILKRAVPPTVN